MNIDFYINAVYSGKEGNSTFTVSELPSTVDLKVGNFIHGTSFPLNGDMRDVAIYDRVLSVSELGSNFIQTVGCDKYLLMSYPDLLYYKMDGGTTATSTPQYLADYSINGGSTGRIGGTYVFWTNGNTGAPLQSVHFNGDSNGDYIDTGNSTLFNFLTNSFTINVWIYPESPNGFVMGNWDGTTNGWYISVGGAYSVNFGTSAVSYIATADSLVNSLTWTMITFTRQGNNEPVVYINGQPNPVSGVFLTPNASSTNLLFGHPSIGTNYLDGNLWQPQIWATNFSQKQVAVLYSRQKDGHYWP
jgi:Concanavalin A-like lectin/glucanases superfamily